MRKVTRLFLLPILILSVLNFLHAAEVDTQVVTAKMLMVEKRRVLDGVLEAVHQATISAQTSGRVEKIFFDVDDTVNKGDILIQFHAREQQALFNAAQAEFKEAEAEYKRTQDIYAQKLVAKAVLDKAEARFKAAKARLEQASENLAHTQVRAPYNGIVVKRHIEEGELARVGQNLMTGLSLEALRARVELPQSLVQTVRQQKQASLVLPGSQRIQAESMTVSPYADPTSHTFLVRVNLPKGDYAVYPGMLVKVAFVTGDATRLVVPEQAIAQRGEVSAVYVQDKDGKLSYRHVRRGELNAELQVVEILSGLDAGEKVLLDTVKAASLLKQQEH